MNKYKSIQASSHRQSLEEAIEHRLITNRIVRMTIDDNQREKTLMSTNKSIIYIKLPKKVQKHLNSFRASLYQSSLKRLKQQNVTLFKEIRIPNITNKKPYQSFQEEVIRKAIKEKGFQKKNPLPNVYSFYENQDQRKHNVFLQKLQQKSEEQQEQSKDYRSSNTHLQNPQKKSIFSFDGAALGFHNLKQKYLQLRQLSLNNKRKSQLLQKHDNKRSVFDDQFNQYDTKIKMDKQIVQHMNRYMKKDLFQTKVNGLKTTIYPNSKTNKKEENSRQRNRQERNIQTNQKLSNFIKRKKMRSCAQNVSGQYPRSSFEMTKTRDEPQSQVVKVNAKMNPELFKGANDCTPWQTTDMINFD